MTVTDGFSDQEHAAMRIRARTCEEFTVGSGFMLDEHTVVTNRHVVEDAQTITLTTYDGEQYEGTASVMADFADLALVTVDEPLEFAAPIATTEPAPDDELDVVGYPLGGPLETRTGPFIKRVPDTIGEGRDDVDLIKVQAEHGNSGSAVYDDAGKVVGVLYATDKKGESFAVTLESLSAFLSDTSLQLPNDADCQ
ncbi:S1 family peptidase [Demequina oxidasica]|uniref:S1 family peptidase n=1 Tax=Demequina oxidasica TaxID=676199 RepID=UPI0013648A79|nr:serine protease [Demequina oxidasica]